MAATNLTTNLTNYWKLDEATGNAVDVIGGDTGTNSNVTFAACKIHNGAVFNGLTASLGLASPPLNGTVTAFTVSAWFFTTTSTGALYVLGICGPAACATRDWSGFFRLSTKNIGVVYCKGSSLYEVYTTTNPIEINTWYHGVVTYDNTYLTLYINGVALINPNVGTGLGYSSSYASVIGGRPGPASLWNGKIDEVGVWSRCLTATEVKELYANGGANQYPFASGKMVNFLHA